MRYDALIADFLPANDQEQSDKKLIQDLIWQYGDELLSRETAVAHITSSGLVINESFDKILMVHHNIYNTWTWTGGHSDGDQDLLAVALKEAVEETGVRTIRPFSEKILSLDILPVYGHRKNSRYVSAHLHLSAAFLLIAEENEPLTINPHENSGVLWVPRSEAAEYSNEPFMLEIYQKILKRARTEL